MGLRQERGKKKSADLWPGKLIPQRESRAILANPAAVLQGEILCVSKLCVHYRIIVENCFKAEPCRPGKF